MSDDEQQKPLIVDGITQLSPQQSWKYLADDPEAVLVDVRTTTEWASIGIPNLESLEKSPILIEWNTAPFGEPNPFFLEKLQENVREDQPIVFLCRSGGRSQAAAAAALAAGYDSVINVVNGFEGGPGAAEDVTQDRGGWKKSGLPWQKP